MDSDWSLRQLDGHDGIVLVTVDLRNPSSVDRRVRVRNRLDGPVLPPRRAGAPEPGWDHDGFTGVVPATGRHTLGYACPAPVQRPPVAVVSEGRAKTGEQPAEPMAATAVRELGDPRPPADAVPDAPDVGHVDGGENDVGTDGSDLPPPVMAWLTAVERRVERGERLTDASVETAASVLADEGDDAWEVSELDARLSTDAAALRAVSERTAALADRASAVDVPVPALRRFA